MNVKKNVENSAKSVCEKTNCPHLEKLYGVLYCNKFDCSPMVSPCEKVRHIKERREITKEDTLDRREFWTEIEEIGKRYKEIQRDTRV